MRINKMIKNSERNERIIPALNHLYLIVFLFITLFVNKSNFAQDKIEEIDKIFSAYNNPEAPGCVVAVSQNGKLIANRSYGSADLERDVLLTPGSIFDIGSVRKQFIAAAVLILAEDGKLSLSDDIQKYFPELPDYGSKVTIDHLLTHTSGIRDWTALKALTAENVELLPMILRQRGLNFEPGEEWSYSNSGYVLLTELIARTGGMDVADFTRKRIFEPLGMNFTHYGEDPLDLVMNRALGYEKEGEKWEMGVLFGAERGRGSGAIFSTASDLVIWSNAIMNARLGKFVTEKLQEPAKLNNGRELTYARGVMVNNYSTGKLVSHSGDAAGYSAWVGGLHDHNLSVAVLSNFNPVSATDLAHRVMELFLPEDSDEEKDSEPEDKNIELAEPDLKSKAGLYFSENSSEPIYLAAKNGKLQIIGGPQLTWVTKDKFRNARGNLFFMSQDEFEINFLADDQFELKSMEGKTTLYKKVQPIQFAVDELKSFEGRYESDEVKSAVNVKAEEGGLLVSLEYAPERTLDFKPVNKDTFQWRVMTIRFIRDNQNKITALEYNSPLLSNFKFKRLDH